MASLVNESRFYTKINKTPRDESEQKHVTIVQRMGVDMVSSSSKPP